MQNDLWSQKNLNLDNSFVKTETQKKSFLFLTLTCTRFFVDTTHISLQRKN